MMENTVKKEVNVLIPFPVKGTRLTDRQIDNRLQKIEDLKKQEADLKAARETLEKEIQKYMGDIEHIQTGRYKVNYTRTCSSRLDSKALKAEKPKLYAQFLKTSVSRRFSFSAL